MPVTRSHKLRMQLYQYTRELRNKLYQELGKENVKKPDYPAVADGCRLKKKHDFGHSRACNKCLWEDVPFVPPLYAALSGYGTPLKENYNNQGKRIYVGTCAEDMCANKVLQAYKKRHRSYPSLSEIRFIQPVRPRTNQCVKFCEVCKSVFSL